MIREEDDGSLALVAVDDSRTEREVTYIVTDVQSNHVLISGEAVAHADSAVLVATVPDPTASTGMLQIRWTSGDQRGINHFLYGKSTIDLTRYRTWLASSYEDEKLL